LTICKLLVDMMGGQIGFRSEIGEGSSFWVSFALPKAPRSADGPQPKACGRSLLNASWEAAKGGPQKTQVLVAENDRLSRSMIELLMTRTGCIVVLAGSGREALTVLTSARFDLAFVGAGIPDLAGLDVIREIRRREAGTGEHLKTIALTAQGEGPDHRACIESGADDCLVKPLTAEALFEVVQRQTPGFLASTGQTSGDAGRPPDDSDICDTLATTIRAAGDVLEQGDFDELETLAGELRKLASRVRAKGVSDHAMRLRLAARGRNPRRAAEAIAKVQAAVDGLGAASKQTDSPIQSCL
jgi:CheY-like chemotaxis protein